MLINSSESIGVLSGGANFSSGIAGAFNLAEVGRVGWRLSACSGGGSDCGVSESAASPGVGATVTGLSWVSWSSSNILTKWPSLDELFDGSCGGGGNECSNNSGEFHFVLLILIIIITPKLNEI
jgi:hypothetical protein